MEVFFSLNDHKSGMFTFSMQKARETEQRMCVCVWGGRKGTKKIYKKPSFDNKKKRKNKNMSPTFSLSLSLSIVLFGMMQRCKLIKRHFSFVFYSKTKNK